MARTDKDTVFVGTLLYLPLRARAECLRMMMHFAGLDFIDETISVEDWPRRKSAMPPGDCTDAE